MISKEKKQAIFRTIKPLFINQTSLTVQNSANSILISIYLLLVIMVIINLLLVQFSYCLVKWEAHLHLALVIWRQKMIKKECTVYIGRAALL